MRPARALVVVALFGALTTGVPSTAAVNVFVSGVPGATVGFVPASVTVAKGLPVTFFNPDVLATSGHDVTALDATRPKSSAPWCADFVGPCPLFWSETITAGSATPVLGFEDAVVGRTYAYYCSVHPQMVGSVTVG